MRRMLTTAALAAALATPALADRSAEQRQQDSDRSGARQGQEMSQEARACIEELERIDQRLAELGYGRAGPGGYGVYGGPYGGMPPPTATERGTGALTPAASTPRSDMYALMRAGYIMAQQGFDQGCQQVARAAAQISDRYEQALQAGEVDREGMARWRGDFLGSAVKVSELERPLRAEEIIGGDLRNMRDEDLGDIEDVVLGPNGEPRYVIVGTGGFLGMGEDHVPVPWSRLQVTPEPYRDTFVLDVSEQAFDKAPRGQRDEAARMASDERSAEIDRYWEEAAQGEG